MEKELIVGVGKAEITPEMGIQLAGDIGRYRPVKEIHHPLYVKVLIIESGKERVCIISGDVLGLMRNWSDKIKKQVADIISTRIDAIIIYGTQSHSTPFVGNHLITDDFDKLPEELWWVRGGDARYNPVFIRGVENAVKMALSNMKKARLRAVRGIDGRLSFNRRFVMRDGTTQTHPDICDPNILHCEGPTDPEVGILSFEDKHGKPFAMILHHTCHPVHGYPENYVCPDWPGLWAEGVEDLFSDSIALVANGACGNIHHTQHLNPDYKPDVNAYTALLMETTKRILPNLQHVSMNPLSLSTTSLKIPRRQLTKKELSNAKKLIAEHPDPIWKSKDKLSIEWDWVYAMATLDLDAQYQKQNWYSYEIQLIRIGDVAILAWPGEPFVEAQLKFKLNSPAKFNFVVHFSGDSTGYIPTRQALAGGGYETRTSNWSKLDASAFDTITKKSIEMVKKLFKDQTAE